MTSDSYRYPAEVRRPLHPMLLGFPAACFIGTMLTDIAYWATAQMIWANFSAGSSLPASSPAASSWLWVSSTRFAGG